MFYYLNGKLTHLEPGIAVIDCGGVGYKLTISGTTYDAMPKKRSLSDPSTVLLYTYLAVREDGIELFGFATQSELSSFQMLISVSGVGPKAAMSILTLLSPEKFALAVCTEDKKTIAKANGIGPKTAARIILELHDRMLKENPSAGSDMSAVSQGAPSPARGKMNEALDALSVLGYSRAEALNVLKDMDTSNLELEEIVRLSLKKLVRF